MSRPARTPIAGILLVLLLLLTACSGAEETATDDATSEDATAEEPIDDATSEEATPEDEPAEEDPGEEAPSATEKEATATEPATALDPQPLDEPTTLRLGVPLPLEVIAPALLAQAYGEFEAENLTVELVQDTVPNLYVLLGQGEIDVLYGGASALAFNALRRDVPVRWLAGQSSAIADSGLFIATTHADPDTYDPASLAGTAIRLAPGDFAAPSALPAYEELVAAGLTAADVTSVPLPDTPSTLEALANGGVQAALLSPPASTQAVTDGLAFLIRPYREDIQIGGYFGTSTLVEERPEVGQAFFRAMQRTIDTHLQPGYHDDPDVVADLAEALGSEPEIVAAGAEFGFAFDVPDASVTVLQDMYDDVGGLLQYDEPITPDEFIDTSLLPG